MHHSDSVETILMELEAGIIPTAMFRHKMVCNADPFKGMDLKKTWRLDIFEKSLIDLNEKQFIFVNNEKETVTVTQYGVNKYTDKD
jgi:hypothetical protein